MYKRQLELYVDAAVEIELACTPIANMADIENLLDRKLLSPEKAGEHLFNILGLPLSDMNKQNTEQPL